MTEAIQKWCRTDEREPGTNISDVCGLRWHRPFDRIRV